MDLSPTTGPVPIMVPAGALADASAIDESVLRPFDEEAEASPETEVQTEVLAEVVTITVAGGGGDRRRGRDGDRCRRPLRPPAQRPRPDETETADGAD